MKIGFIGTGVMGNAMCVNLLKANNELFIYTRTKKKAQNLIDLGAKYAKNPKEVAKNSDIIMTMVGYPKDVESVYLGDGGIIEGISSGKICIDFTTSSASLAKKIAKEFNKFNVSVLDAPVSGGDIGAKNATLSIMVGGDKKSFEILQNIFKQIGEQIIYQGESGNGQQTKMMNQIALAGSVLGAMELVAYAKMVNMDPQKVLESVKYGAAGSVAMDVYLNRIFKNDFEPGFYIKHFVKDLKIAIDECHEHNVNLPGLEVAYKLYKQLEDEGFGDLGTQALIKAYE